MKIKLIIASLFLLLTHNSVGQNIILPSLRSDSIELIKDLMRKNREVTSYAIGYSGKQSKQYYRFIFLLNTLTNSELVQLTKDTSGCLRLYAYTCLIHNRYKEIEWIKSNMQKDSTLVPIQYGCAGGTMYLFDALKKIDKWYQRNQVFRLLKEYNNEKEFWYKNFVSSH